MLQKIFNKIKYIFEPKPFEIVVKDNNTIQIVINKNIELLVNSDIELTINGEVNIISDNFYLDTRSDENGSRLYLNSRLAKQIRNKPYAIEYRRKLKKFREKMKKLSSEIQKESIPASVEDEKQRKELSK